MQKYAVIDIGSNSVRLMLLADGKVLYKTLNTTRLGEGIAQSSRLKAEAIERTAAAVETFYKRALQEGACKVFAFATAAVRSAENGREFVSAVYSRCGVAVEVVSGETEAELGILGALGKSDGAVIDVGGASTELVVKQNSRLVYKKSVDIGVVRLKDLCGTDKRAIWQTVLEKISAFNGVPKATLYAIGGTATTLAALSLGLQTYSFEKVTGHTIEKEVLRGMAETLLSSSPQEIAKMPCVTKGREDVLAGGAAILVAVLDRLGFDGITVSDRENLEGYAIRKGLLE